MKTDFQWLAGLVCGLFLVAMMAIPLAWVTIAKAYGSEQELDSIFAQMLAPSFKLYQGDRPLCSATVIHSEENKEGEIETYLLTADHCLGDDLNIRRQTLDENLDTVKETIYFAKKVRAFKKEDVAVLMLLDKTERFPVALVAPVDTVARPGRDMWAVGYPKTLELTITHGESTGLAKTPDGGIFHRATPPIHGGSSGGGLFVKVGNQYMIYGVTSGHYRDTSFMNYFARLSSIHRVIPKLHKAELPREF